MNKVFLHIRVNIVQGVLAVVPAGLCIIAAFLIYEFIDHRIMVFLDQFVDVHQIPGFGLILLLMFLYIIGLVTSNVIGRQILSFIEWTSARIPLVKEIYALSKQVGDTLANSKESVFKKAVLVNYPNRNQWTIGFLAGRIKDERNGEFLMKVYVPMAHPLIGFVFLAREDQVVDTGWGLPETFKMLVSVGIIPPKRPPV